MFRVTGLKIIGRVGTVIIIFNYFFFNRNAFKMHKKIPENLKKILGFTSKIRLSLLTLNTGIFLFGLGNTVKNHFFVILFYLMANPI